MWLAVKRAAAAGADGPSYARARALALQPDPRRHAQARRGLKGSASRQRTQDTSAGVKPFYLDWRRVEGLEEQVDLTSSSGPDLQERKQWIVSVPAGPLPSHRRRRCSQAQTLVRITLVSSLTRALLDVITAGHPSSARLPGPKSRDRLTHLSSFTLAERKGNGSGFSLK